MILFVTINVRYDRVTCSGKKDDHSGYEYTKLQCRTTLESLKIL